VSSTVHEDTNFHLFTFQSNPLYPALTQYTYIFHSIPQPGCHEKIIAHVRARNAHELMLNVLRKLNIEDAKKFVLTHESTLVDTYIGGSTQVCIKLGPKFK
jgi:hypothetical protein